MRGKQAPPRSQRDARLGRTRSVFVRDLQDACFRIAEQERGFEAGAWPELVVAVA